MGKNIGFTFVTLDIKVWAPSLLVEISANDNLAPMQKLLTKSIHMHIFGHHMQPFHTHLNPKANIVFYVVLGYNSKLSPISKQVANVCPSLETSHASIVSIGHLESIGKQGSNVTKSKVTTWVSLSQGPFPPSKHNLEKQDNSQTCNKVLFK